jgi:hypothetical protein
MSYPEKRGGKLTGYWYGEVRSMKTDQARFRRRFGTREEAEGYEAYVKAVGHEPAGLELSDLSSSAKEHLIISLMDEVNRLKSELRNVREDIIGCAPPEAREKLQGYRACTTSEELWEWRRSVIEFVIGLAQPIPKASYFEERAYCPLCRGGGRSPYTPGYKVPSGLELHLQGNRALLCPVMEAAWSLALETLAENEKSPEPSSPVVGISLAPSPEQST